MAARDNGDGKDVATLVTELADMIVRYAKQETVEPIRDLRRYLGFGLAGSLLMSIGIPLLLLGELRAIQVETFPHLTGNLTWVPYTIVFLTGAGIIAVLVTRIGKVKRNVERRRAELAIALEQEG
jgi:ABC-type Mn2+/Zn2+ transport system permease subunit